MITHDSLMQQLYHNQGIGSRMAFKFILEDAKVRKNGGILINSDQGASKTVFSGAILMLALMQKSAYEKNFIKEKLFDKVIFLSFSDNVKSQIEGDFKKYLYKVDNYCLSEHPDMIITSVNKNNLIERIKNLKGNNLMVIDEPQKGFSMSDMKKNGKKKSSLYYIIHSTPNTYKIFLTATPMTNSILDMVHYVSTFLNKKSEQITIEDIMNPDTYKNRIYFVSSSVVNFINQNIIFSKEQVKNYQSIDKDGSSGDFIRYIMKDEPNKYLNTAKVEISNTQMNAMIDKVKNKKFGVGGISTEAIKLSVVSGKEYERINNKGFSPTFQESELFEISPKIHYIYKYETGKAFPGKSIVKVKIYSNIFLSGTSTDGNIYLFEYFKLYPEKFEEFTIDTKELDIKKVYYMNIFDRSDGVAKKYIQKFNILPENTGTPVICFIPGKYATGYTYTKIKRIYLWEYEFHYSGDSQAFGRISRNGQMPDEQQEAIMLESDVNISSLDIQRQFRITLKGDLNDDELKKYKDDIIKYYQYISDEYEENKNNYEEDMLESELSFRKRFRALYPSFTRKSITHNKLKIVSNVENIMNSQNVLHDLIDESKSSQLFPMRRYVPRGKYYQKKRSIDINSKGDIFNINREYVNIYMDFVHDRYLESTKHKPYGISNDIEPDTIIINSQELSNNFI